jgi:CcmD family protein
LPSKSSGSSSPRWRALLVAALTCGVLVLLVAPVFAQPPSTAQGEFVPVKPGELGQEQLPAAPLVFAAYSVVWLALLTYVFMLWRRLTRVERDLADVSSRLSRTRR